MLVKFEQIRIVQTSWNFELFDQKLRLFKIIFLQSVDAILENVSVAAMN